jgi:sarcosine oxidase gamma subunit
MRAFRRDSSGAAVARFDREEAGILRHLSGEMLELLDRSVSSEEARTDPALARLLPDAYRDDAEAAAEFRRFTGPDLAGRKMDDARAITAALDAGDGSSHGRVFAGLGEVAVRLEGPQAIAWMRALTDMRLALAVRLGIDRADDVEPEGDTAAAIRSVYDWLGGVQDGLVRAVDS